MDAVIKDILPLVLAAAAAARIDESRLTPAQQAVGLLIFVALASTSIAIVVLSLLVFDRTSRQSLAAAKDWLTDNNFAVMVVLLFVFGTILVGGSIDILIR